MRYRFPVLALAGAASVAFALSACDTDTPSAPEGPAATRPQTASTATLTVPDDYSAIQQAINAATSGDMVLVRSGTYSENLTISKRLILKGEGKETTIIDGGQAGPVIHVTADHVTISRLKVTNGVYGISTPTGWGGAISHLTIRNTIIDSNQGHAIRSGHTRGNWLIEDCIISNNGGGILQQAHQSNNFVIRNCEIFGNGGPLDLGWGSNAVVTDNSIHDNDGGGIGFDSMRRSLIEKNEIYSNNGYGIQLGYVAGYNTVRDNIVRHNNLGIKVETRTYGNKIYHNDLIANTVQARDRGSNDTWDDGYPSGGNYWSDYTGEDVDNDGIGDTPYLFDSNRDNYPQMGPLWYVLSVDIDIKPGSDPNTINPKSNGVVPVAILGSDDFDVTDVDVTTLEFGPGAATPGHMVGGHLEDVNHDGFTDLVSHYRQKETGLQPGDTEACVTGATTGGIPIEGCDAVRVLDK